VLDQINRQPPDARTSAGRICIVTGEIAGPDFNGGIGTANRGLALALCNAGYTVDVLYTRVENGQPFCFRGSFDEQVAAFRALGVNLMCINHKGTWNDWLGKSLRVMETLQSKSYDIAFFDDTHGTAYYTALARRTGSPALADTRIVVVTHSATQWICDLNQAPVTSLADAQLLEIERRSIELADYLVSPSAYILRKYQSYGWTLPPNTLVRPNILPFSAERTAPERREVPIDEIVFFGRLERRKGLWLFCEALDQLKYELGGRKVTFLGKFTHEDGESTGYALLRRSAEWPFAPTLLYNYDRVQALSYLKGGNRLAVMPSREDNSPCVILECLIEGIPFIASAGSGGQELIDSSDHGHCLFEPTAEGLTEKLRHVLSKGATTAQPAFDPRENARQTMAWVSTLVADVRRQSATGTGPEPDTEAASTGLARSFLLLAPPELSPEQITEGGREIARRNPGCSVLIFMGDDQPLPEKPGSKGQVPPANLRHLPLSSFTAEVAKLNRAGGMLLLSRLDQPVTEQLLERAEAALCTTDIGALTAMRGHAIENVRPEKPYVCAGAFHWEPEDYRTGNTYALMSISQDSNAGVVILRSELAGVLASVSPRDAQLCRLKDVDLYVHEVLLELAEGGHSFELLPDCFLPPAAVATSHETFDLPRIAMRHMMKTKGMAPGSEAALLSRLTVERFASDAAQQNARDLLADMISRMGEAILQPGNFWPPSKAFATYATIAHASGRPDLALSLAANALTTESEHLRRPESTPASIALRQSKTLELAALMSEGRYSGLNLDHPWSLRTDQERQFIEIHPNGSYEGDAALVFSNLSFHANTVFSAELELEASAKGPVKFEIELQAPSIQSQSQEWILQPGERKSVEFPLPEVFQAGCDALLATRMMRRRDSTEGAHAKWHKPAFQPR
jgi:glycosyltransferase involved in cell wall biosynthesis